jgi:Flp pilus assembly protein TadB
VQALGIGVTPHELELETHPASSASGSLKVFNTSDEKSRYQVYVEGEIEEWFTITPEEFVLDPRGSRGVRVVVSPPPTASGEYRTSICIISLVSASELKVGAGVKVPVHIRIVPAPPLATIGINLTGTPLLVLLSTVAFLFVALVTVIFVWRRRKPYG